MSERIYVEANGRCICEIHREFLAKNGYTVDEYYERNPHITPWYMKTCPGCPNPNWTPPAATEALPEPQTFKSVKPRVEQVEQVITKQVESEPQVVQWPAPEVKQPEFSPIAERMETEPMCNPFVQQGPCSDQCARENAAIARNRKLMALGLAAVVGGTLAIATAGVLALALVAAMPFAAAIVLGWKYRYEINDFVCDAAAFPFLLLWHGVVAARQTMQARRRPTTVAQPSVMLLSGPVAITEPRRLLEVQTIEPIELPAQKQPLKVSKPKKVKVPHGHRA